MELFQSRVLRGQKPNFDFVGFIGPAEKSVGEPDILAYSFWMETKNIPQGLKPRRSGRIIAGNESPAYRPKCRESRIHTDSEVMPFHIPAVSGGLISLVPSPVPNS